MWIIISNYLLFAVITAVVCVALALFLHVSIGAILSFAWGGCVVILILNYRRIWRWITVMLPVFFPELASILGFPPLPETPVESQPTISSNKQAPISNKTEENEEEINEIIRKVLKDTEDE